MLVGLRTGFDRRSPFRACVLAGRWNLDFPLFPPSSGEWVLVLITLFRSAAAFRRRLASFSPCSSLALLASEMLTPLALSASVLTWL